MQFEALQYCIIKAAHRETVMHVNLISVWSALLDTTDKTIYNKYRPMTGSGDQAETILLFLLFPCSNTLPSFSLFPSLSYLFPSLSYFTQLLSYGWWFRMVLGFSWIPLVSAVVMLTVHLFLYLSESAGEKKRIKSLLCTRGSLTKFRTNLVKSLKKTKNWV